MYKESRSKKVPLIKREIAIATSGGVEKRKGYVLGSTGLGLIWFNQFGYMLTHVPTGHGIIAIKTNSVHKARKLAEPILALGSWCFESLDGYKNQNPDLIDKVFSMSLNAPDLYGRPFISKRDPLMAREVYNIMKDTGY